MNKFSDTSKQRLETCHPDLQHLFNEVLKKIDITIICGYRGEKEQNIAFESGYSELRYPYSKHNSLPSLAVDVLPYPSLYSDSRAIYHLAGYIKGVAERLGIGITWGGDWVNFRDVPHYQLKQEDGDIADV